jgi:glycosyltransferase involved in cell wall biosynthesis
VLTSNESALPEIAGDAALCVNPFDVEAIKEGIEKLVDDQELYNNYKLKGLQRAQDFSWKTTAKETWDIIISEMNK